MKNTKNKKSSAKPSRALPYTVSVKVKNEYNDGYIVYGLLTKEDKKSIRILVSDIESNQHDNCGRIIREQIYHVVKKSQIINMIRH